MSEVTVKGNRARVRLTSGEVLSFERKGDKIVRTTKRIPKGLGLADVYAAKCDAIDAFGLPQQRRGHERACRDD